jgi:hypothetical protein
MKKFLLLLVLASAALFGTELNKKVTYGMEEVTGGLFDSFQSYGTIKLTEVKIIDKLDVAGQLEARACEMGRLLVKGKATLYNCQVKKKTEIYGFFRAVATHFDNLTIASDRVVLEGCTAKNMPLMEGGRPEVVELLGATKVHSITFASGKGEVLLGPEASVAGKVVGGVVKKQ